jgi:ribosomal protein S18 acetylase RimI-like enzyme
MSPSMEESLDRPIWAALSMRQTHLGYGNTLARRYHASVAPFAGLSVESRAAYEALGVLVEPSESVLVLSLSPPVEGGRLEGNNLGMVHQMVATQSGERPANSLNFVTLSQADSEDMQSLVHRTRPGPFGTRTHEMGRYIGVRDQGRLVAMAGERMRIEGLVEISAVCVDDAWRGKGLAGQLMTVIRVGIEEAGDTAFLHVLSSNANAIALYERLGFTRRRTFGLTRFRLPAP